MLRYASPNVNEHIFYPRFKSDPPTFSFSKWARGRRIRIVSNFREHCGH